VLAGACALLLAQCYTPPAERPESTVAVHQDEFTNFIELKGPEEVENDPGVGVVALRYYLRSGVEKAAPHQVLHQLRTTIFYIGDTVHFDLVTDDTAQPLKFTRIESTSCGLFDPGCVRHETLAIDIPDPTLRQRIDTGYRVKAHAARGNYMTMAMTPLMISKQLASVDEAAQKAGGAGATSGVVFTAVEAGGAAAAAGIEPGDRVLAVDGHAVTSADELKAIFRGATHGQSLMMDIDRDGKRLTVNVQF
jgi:hypothetical protein